MRTILIIVIFFSVPRLFAQSVWTNACAVIQNSIAYGNGLYVLTGDNLQYSTNLTTWVNAHGPVESGGWSGVAYGNGKFIALSAYGLVALSTNGTDFIAIDRKQLAFPEGGLVRYQKIKVLNGRFFVLAGQIFSSAGGETWAPLVAGHYAESFRDITFGGGRYIAVGDYGTVAISTNAINWSKTLPFGPLNHLRSVAFFNDKFYLVDVNGDLFSSYDALTWTNRLSISPNFGVVLLALPGCILSAGATNLYSSTDGVQWQEKAGFSKYYVSSIQILDEKYFVTTAGNGLLMSINAEDWTSLLPEPPTVANLYGSGSDGTNSVAVGANGTILYKEPGQPWIKASSPNTKSYLRSVASFNGTFYAAGSSGLILRSTNGLDWAQEQSGIDNTSFSRVTVANNHLLATAWFGLLLERNNTGHWIQTVVHTNLSITGVAYGKGLYILGGEIIGQGEGGGGAAIRQNLNSLDEVPTVWSSTDLVHWSPALQDPFGFTGAAFGNDVFVLVGYDGRISYSSDGLHWTSATSGTGSYLTNVIFANGKFYIAGTMGALLVSSNGKDWTRISCSSSSTINDMCASHSKLIAVGFLGAIIESPLDTYFQTALRPADPIKLYAPKGARVTIESSPDLEKWADFVTFDQLDNPTELPFTTNSFYRARIH